MKPRPLAIGVLLALAGVAAGPSSKPSKPVPAYEAEPLNVTPEAARRAAEGGAVGEAAPTGGSTFQVVGALVVVVGLIVGLKWVAGRLSLVPNRGKTGAVKVVGRSVLSPKQQVLLIQVGKRLLVVGDSGGAMAPLCEITDPSEVAALIGQAKAAAAERPRPAGAFDKLFRGAAEPFAATDSFAADDDRAATGEEPAPAVGGLLDKVRGLRQQFGQA